MPTSGADQQQCGSTSGSADNGNLTWSMWQNNSGGCMVPYSNAAAFSATFNGTSNGDDFLAHLGLSFNNVAYSSLGTITAQFAETKTASAKPNYSSIGIYGWSGNSPCVEYYIVDDSFNGIPTPGGSVKGSQVIDGETYKFYSITTSGTAGANACTGSASNATSWSQYWSVRQTQRQCGTISVSQHFAAWAANGMPLGNMGAPSITIEVGGGNGSIDFTTASMTMK
jgi:hypothetical protein